MQQDSDVTTLMETPIALPGERTLGTSDLVAAPLAWGMWRFAGNSREDAARLVREAVDVGITLFDTADIYGLGSAGGFGSAEALLGEVLQSERGIRQKIILASKAGIRPPVPYVSSKEYLIKACERSLERLGTDYLDLFQIHRPDILTHPSEVAEALCILRDAGKIRYAGVSNYSILQASSLQASLDFDLITTQPEYSLLHLEPLQNGLLDYATEKRMSVLAWSPLGGGRIAAPESAHENKVCVLLDEVAAAFGVTRTAVAYAWLMAHPAGVIPIIGSQNPTRVRDAMTALQVQWTRGDWYRLYEAALGSPLP